MGGGGYILVGGGWWWVYLGWWWLVVAGGGLFNGKSYIKKLYTRLLLQMPLHSPANYAQ